MGAGCVLVCRSKRPVPGTIRKEFTKTFLSMSSWAKEDFPKNGLSFCEGIQTALQQRQNRGKVIRGGCPVTSETSASLSESWKSNHH
jgi:hypothetical protein